MRIPRFWAHGSATVQTLEGRTATFGCWRWSDRDVAEAQALAEAHARLMAQRFLAGRQLDRYAYDARPLREEMVRPVVDERRAVVTRNSYGALVLNSAELLFADVDFDTRAKPGGLLGLFGRPASPVAERVAKVEAWARRRPDLGVRVYETFGGLRVLLHNRPFAPGEPEAERILKELDSDPLYVRLCRGQACFRARLTPKPWRCGLPNPPARFPFVDVRAETAQRAWERRYETEITAYATCRLVAEFGPRTPAPELGPQIDLHDHLTRARETHGRPLPLA